MLRVLLVLAVLFSLFAEHAFADEIAWMKLVPRFRYRDVNVSCSDSSDPEITELYFVARVNDKNQVTYADLRKTYMRGGWFVGQLAFKADELPSIDLQKNAIGDYWIKKLPLNGRILNWIFFNLTNSPFGCRPSHPLKTMGPFQEVFEFQPRDANSYFTPLYEFDGELMKDGAYSAKLGFIQSMFDNP